MKRFMVKSSNYRQKSNCGKSVVAGAEKGVGSTHFAIILANYYAEILGQKTAIIDLNKDKDYTFLEEICVPDKSDMCSSYKIKKVNYYSGVSKERMADVFRENYKCIILDVGANYEQFQNEISMCDKRFFIGAVNPWRVQNYINALDKKFIISNRFKWKYLYAHGDEESADYIDKVCKSRLEHIPYIPDPFRINGKQLSIIEKIIWEE